MRKVELESITIKGFKSIKSLDNFRPGPINVLIGQNGAGKSNLIGFYKFLSNMLGGTGNLRDYTAMLGGASELLFDGPENTPQLSANLSLRTSAGLNEYSFRLSHASGDTFIFNEEKFKFTPNNMPPNKNWSDLGAGHKEAALISAEATGRTQGTVRKILQQLVVYQFHNTTFTSPIRNTKAEVENGWYLEEDGRNLPAVLLELKNNQAAIYQKILSVLQQIIPFFDDFILNEEYGRIYLKWKEKNSSKTFVATHASDGMLRAMALVTLLCLPRERLPGVMFIDEPELGLHPSAISSICSLFHGISEHCQVIIATQNADMLNEFTPDDIVIVTRRNRYSEFNRLQESELIEWRDDYSLAELWNRNIIGGRP